MTGRWLVLVEKRLPLLVQDLLAATGTVKIRLEGPYVRARGSLPLRLVA